jgi:thioredoxin-related protein
MIKSIVVTFILLVAALTFTALDHKKEGIIWISLEEAQELAKEEPRNVIVDMYTDWCGWCKKMDRTTFVDQEVAELANQKFYAVKINAESLEKINFKGEDTNGRLLARQFRVPGYPTYILLNKDFELKEQVVGYKGEEEFLRILAKFDKSNP